MYRKTRLPSGMTVVTETIPYVKSVSIGVWVGTGSRCETENNHGVSHFIEHMMFKGTEKRSAKQIAELVDAVGGQLNAFTAKEYTCYYMKVLDNHFGLAMDVLSDMMLHSKFAEEDLNREREVVLEEIKMYQDSPDELIHDLLLEDVWPEHPLGSSILGTADRVQGLSQAVVREYYQRYYTPDNMVIAAVGNITHDQVVNETMRYFSAMKGQKPTLVQPQPRLQPHVIVHNRDLEQVHVCLGTRGLAQDDSNIYSLHILNNLLGGGISSRLFQTIREDRGLAYSVYSYQSSYRDAGLFTVYAGTRPTNAQQVIDLVMQEFQKLRDQGLSSDELRQSQEQLKGNLVLGLESTSSRMSRLGKLELCLHKHITMEEVIDKIDAVTIDDMHDMIDYVVDPNYFYMTALGPATQLQLPSMEPKAVM